MYHVAWSRTHTHTHTVCYGVSVSSVLTITWCSDNENFNVKKRNCTHSRTIRAVITQDTHRVPLTHPDKLSTQTSRTHCTHTRAHMASAHANTPKGKSDGVVKALQIPPESLSYSCILSWFSQIGRASCRERV